MEGYSIPLLPRRSLPRQRGLTTRAYYAGMPDRPIVPPWGPGRELGPGTGRSGLPPGPPRGGHARPLGGGPGPTTPDHNNNNFERGREGDVNNDYTLNLQTL